MYIRYCGEPDGAEVEWGGERAGFQRFAKSLALCLDVQTIRLDLRPHEFFPQSAAMLQVRVTKDEGGRISMHLSSHTLGIAGSRLALSNLAETLVDFAEHSREGAHLHLDSFEGSQVVRDSNCSVVVVVE